MLYLPNTSSRQTKLQITIPGISETSKCFTNSPIHQHHSTGSQIGTLYKNALLFLNLKVTNRPYKEMSTQNIFNQPTDFAKCETVWVTSWFRYVTLKGIQPVALEN